MGDLDEGIQLVALCAALAPTSWVVEVVAKMSEKPEVRMTNPRFLTLWGRAVLTGNVYGHPKFVDGHSIVTSEIVSRDGNRVETRNTIYTIEAD
jgi:hypothetical protein